MRRRLSLIFAGLLAVAAGLFVAAATLGAGARTEFSPDTLQSRTRAEFVIPGTELAVYRGPWSAPRRWPAVDRLVAGGYWAVSAAPEPRWLGTARENRQWRDGISRLELELAGHGDEWARWSDAHPAIARALWPRLLGELRRPGATAVDAEALLFAARGAGTVEEFESLLRE